MPRRFSRLRALLSSSLGSIRGLNTRQCTIPTPELRQEELQREQQIDRHIDSIIHKVPPHLRMALRTSTAGMDVSNLTREGIRVALANRKRHIDRLLQEYSHATGAAESFRKESRDIDELQSVLPTLSVDPKEV